MKKTTRIMNQMTDTSGHPSLAATVRGAHARWTPSAGRPSSPRHAKSRGGFGRIAASLQLHEVGTTVPYRDAAR